MVVFIYFQHLSFSTGLYGKILFFFAGRMKYVFNIIYKISSKTIN
jgi:hypothetical protein